MEELGSLRDIDVDDLDALGTFQHNIIQIGYQLIIISQSPSIC